MPVESLETQKRAIQKQYSVRELFDLVFTDYKNYPTELAKIKNLQLYVQQKVGQITNSVGVQQKNVIQDLFTIVNEIQLIPVAQLTEEVIIQLVDSAGYVGTAYGVSDVFPAG